MAGGCHTGIAGLRINPPVAYGALGERARLGILQPLIDEADLVTQGHIDRAIGERTYSASLEAGHFGPEALVIHKLAAICLYALLCEERRDVLVEALLFLLIARVLDFSAGEEPVVLRKDEVAVELLIEALDHGSEKRRTRRDLLGEHGRGEGVGALGDWVCAIATEEDVPRDVYEGGIRHQLAQGLEVFPGRATGVEAACVHDDSAMLPQLRSRGHMLL